MLKPTKCVSGVEERRETSNPRPCCRMDEATLLIDNGATGSAGVAAALGRKDLRHPQAVSFHTFLPSAFFLFVR